MAEVKEYGKPITDGQMYLMKNLVKHMGGPYDTYGYVLWHEVKEDEDIILKDTIVKEFYAMIDGKLETVDCLSKRITFKEAFDKLKEPK